MDSVRGSRPEELAVEVQQRLFEALHASEQRARRRLEALTEVVFELDGTGRLTFLNHAWTTVLGHDVEASLHRPLGDFCDEQDAARLVPGAAADVGRFRHHDGGDRLLQVRYGGATDDGGVTGTLTDVTEQRAVEERAELERLFLVTVLDNLSEAVFACDPRGRMMLSNRGSLSKFVEADDWLEHYEVLHEDGLTPLTFDELPLTRALRGERVDAMTIVGGRRGREPRHLLVRAQQMRDASGRVLGALAVATDITEQHAAEERLRHLSRHDALTGLPNRRAFLEMLGEEGGSAVVLVDLDAFRGVNDRFGPVVGDQVLREVAQRLDQLAAASGRVARVAADTFALLVDAPDALAASQVAAAVTHVLRSPFQIQGQRVEVTASIGAALVRECAGEDAGAALTAAEAALQRAGRDGAGSYLLFAPYMRTEGAVRLEYEAALQRAMDEEQFSLVYQPKVALDSDRVTGVEALLRWQHPERGVVSPAEFISIAEQTGLIVPLGRWVLEESLRQAAQWQADHPDQAPLEMCVNVSARQFDHGLADTVRAALTASGLDPATVWLEVTESMVMADVDAAVDVLRSLKELGVHVTVDDFGTGYSSLAYLRRLPLDGLKIDRSFVDGLGQEAEDTAIVAAIVGMAHALDLLVVAEGIETEEQLLALRNLGCESGQGYYYARPQPPAFIDDLLRGAAGAQHATLRPVGHHEVPRAPVVLVVDDAADVRHLARMSLATGGFEVHEAAGGQEGILAALRLRPDCVVLDVHMPDVTGFEVCRALRADPGTAGCTIVMLTGTDQAADKVAAFSAGADDYVLKPFAPRDLLGRARNAMERRNGGRA